MSSLNSTSAIVEAEVTNITSIKNRSLCSRYLDFAYPSRMPFYLYGAGQEIHIDHVLLQSPNAQVSAGEVIVELIEGSKSAFTSGLKDGLIAVANTLPEHLMQPFTSDRLKYIFHPGAKLYVTVYSTPEAADSQRSDFCAQLSEPIARATITLGANTFIDEYMINLDAPVMLPQSPKTFTIPKRTPFSQDHPIFRGNIPSGPADQYTSARDMRSWRELWDEALASRQFSPVDATRNPTSPSASDRDCGDYSSSSVALGRPPILLFRD
jgi:hypothetical protein